MKIRHLIIGLGILLQTASVHAQEPTPRLAAATQPPAAKFFPIAPTVRIHPPARMVYRPTDLAATKPAAIRKSKTSLNDEQARKILEVYPN